MTEPRDPGAHRARAADRARVPFAARPPRRPRQRSRLVPDRRGRDRAGDRRGGRSRRPAARLAGTCSTARAARSWRSSRSSACSAHSPRRAISAAQTRSFFGDRAPRRSYYVAIQLFWAALLAVPLVDNLAIAWILDRGDHRGVRAAGRLRRAPPRARGGLEVPRPDHARTRGRAAGDRRPLRRAWARGGLAPSARLRRDPRRRTRARRRAGASSRSSSSLGGLADEDRLGAGPQLAARRAQRSAAARQRAAVGGAAARPSCSSPGAPSSRWSRRSAARASALFLGFGLASLAVAVPFLWRPLPLKRLLAYSSLEHMGVLALGIGFAHPLATAGVVIHVAGHALAKSLGFYAAIPLLRGDAALSRDAPRVAEQLQPAGAAAIGVSLASLSGMPPGAAVRQRAAHPARRVRRRARSSSSSSRRSCSRSASSGLRTRSSRAPPATPPRAARARTRRTERRLGAYRLRRGRGARPGVGGVLARRAVRLLGDLMRGIS